MPFDKCPKCGFAEVVINRPFTSGMFPFYNKATGEKVIMQRDNKAFIIPASEGKPEVSFITKEEFDAAELAKSRVKSSAPAPTASPTQPPANT